MTPLRLAATLQGATALAAVAALIGVLTLAPHLSSIEHHVREVREEVVTLHLPHGIHATITRKEVMPGPPGHQPGGRPAPASAGVPLKDWNFAPDKDA